MPDSRTMAHVGQYTKPRFRCLVCHVFVIGTERGVCPRCGFAPPVQTPKTGPVDSATWERISDAVDPPVQRYARTPFLVALLVTLLGTGALIAMVSP